LAKDATNRPSGNQMQGDQLLKNIPFATSLYWEKKIFQPYRDKHQQTGLAVKIS
jgi:hypothetical protein